MSTWTRSVTLGALIAGSLTSGVCGADSPAVVPTSPGVETKTEPLPLGHADFHPSPTHPVGERGDWTGLFPGAKGVALEWDHRTGKNVVWKCRLPGWSNSSPIVVGDKVLVTSDPDELWCVDARTGELVWRKSLYIDAFIPEEDRAAVRLALRQIEDHGLLCSAAGAVPKDNYWRVPEYWLGAIAPQEDPAMTETAKRIFEVRRRELDARDKLRRESLEGTKADVKNAVVAPEQAEAVADDAAYSKGIEYSIVTTESKAVLAKYKFLDPRRLKKDSFSGGMWSASHVGISMPTPASDGTHVWVQNRLGVMACLDMQGNVIWTKRLPPSITGFADCGSPVLLGDRLIYTVQGREVYAAEKLTGKDLWSPPKHLYPKGLPVGGRGSSSAVPMRLGGREMILAPGQAILDAATGKMLGKLTQGGDARRGHTAWGDSVIWTYDKALGRDRLTLEGDTVKTDLVWRTRGTPWQASVVHDGYVYASPNVSGFTRLACIPLNADCKREGGWWDSGAVVHPEVQLPQCGAWQLPKAIAEELKAKKLGDPVRDGGWQYGLPVVAEGHLFMGCDYQGMRVIKLDGPKKTAMVSDNFMDIWIRGNPFFQGNRMYVRGFHYLYCIGMTK